MRAARGRRTAAGVSGRVGAGARAKVARPDGMHSSELVWYDTTTQTGVSNTEEKVRALSSLSLGWSALAR